MYVHTFISAVLTNTAKLVRCVLLHSTGKPRLLSCRIPSVDHPPTIWLLYKNICAIYVLYITTYAIIICTL